MNAPSVPRRASTTAGYSLAIGGCLGLAILKFGNPIILDALVGAPSTIEEWVYSSWTFRYGAWLSLAVILLGLPRIELRLLRRHWLFALPAVWLAWQLISATQSISPPLSKLTVLHFSICVLWFYFGLAGPKDIWKSLTFWTPLLVCFLLALWRGFDQHYGGLEATREAFYKLPDWQTYPREYLLKVASDRIFGTLFYPNSLAALVILFLPPLLMVLWQDLPKVSESARLVILGVVAYMGIACLVWSGSKAGWLVMLVVVAVALLQAPFAAKHRNLIAAILLVFGLAAFTVRFSGYFQRGAKSAVARTEYWKAAWQTFLDNPVLGTGPGTFGPAFARIKPPEAEMARLAHNDYLQQASDSGTIGFMAYSAAFFGILVMLYRQRIENTRFLAVWLGLLGWALHSVVDFNLYIPALAWPSFLFLGFLARDCLPDDSR